MKKRIGEQFWKSEATSEVFRADTSEEASLHPYLADIIRARSPAAVLDFGCGDGALLPALDPAFEVALFDINQDAMGIAARRSNSKTIETYTSPESILPEHYDVVVFSFVLICLANEEQFRDVLSHMRRALKPGGMLIIAEAHPCFRDRVFAGHRVDYTSDQPFSYMTRFHEFPICLLGEGEVEFRAYDYHWTLSDLINTVITSGFTIEKLHELSDAPFAGRPANALFPPFLVTCATKQTMKS